MQTIGLELQLLTESPRYVEYFELGRLNREHGDGLEVSRLDPSREKPLIDASPAPQRGKSSRRG